MAFLVYLFVLLVAAGSVIFGLDWTQAPLNPPPYATQQQAATAKPATSARAGQAPATTASLAASARSGGRTVGAAAHDDGAKQAQARAADAADQQETTAAAGHCNVSACSASYQSFRASDCTYQPYSGPRRACTRTAATRTAPKAATATTHPRSARHNDEPRERRLTDRRDYRDDRSYPAYQGYQDNRSGWGFDFFGGGDGGDER